MSGSVRYLFEINPVVWVRVENPHSLCELFIHFPALIDTGADATVIPKKLCVFLGHSFEKGLSESRTAGIGSGEIRTFAHRTKLTVQCPTIHESFSMNTTTFEPVEFPCDFVEQDMNFILLGQRDFLRMFRYAQDGKEGWFSLEQIIHS